MSGEFYNEATATCNNNDTSVDEALYSFVRFLLKEYRYKNKCQETVAIETSRIGK